MIPAGWKKEPLGNWIEEFREKSTVNDQHPVLTSSRNGLILQSEYYGEAGRITSRDNVGFHVVPPMHITYRSRSDDGLFFFNRNETGITGIVSHYYPVFRFRGNDTFFLALLEQIRNRIGDYAVGSSQRVLSLNVLRSVEAIIPPVEEQRRIAEVLSTWDRAIKATEKLIANSQAQKKALMQQLLTGKKRLPGFSGEWRTTTLGTLGEFIKGTGISRSDLVEHGLAAIRYGEIYTLHHYIVESFGSFIPREVAAQSTRLTVGDILFTCSGETAEEIGKCVAFLSREEAYAGGDTIILRNHQQSPEFLGYALNSMPVCIQKAKLGQGNSVVHINARNLAAIAVDLPPPNEQKAIASILCDMRRGIARLQSKLAVLRTEKSALMQQLLTGKRRVKLPSAQEEAA